MEDAPDKEEVKPEAVTVTYPLINILECDECIGSGYISITYPDKKEIVVSDCQKCRGSGKLVEAPGYWIKDKRIESKYKKLNIMGEEKNERFR